MEVDGQALAQTYQDEGYVMVPGLLNAQEVDAFRQAIDEISARAVGKTANDAIFDFEDNHNPEQPRIRRIKAPHLAHPVFRDFMRHPKLMQVLTLLLGANIRHQYVKLNMKSADGGSPLEWHQDWAFYPHTNQSVLAVGLMLDDVTLENGPTLVIPRSHRPTTVHDHTSEGAFVGAIDPANPDVDFDRAVPLVGQAGTITVHHAFLVHGAARNLSKNMRRICFYEFLSADAWPLEGIFPPDMQQALGAFDDRIVQGQPTVFPRMEALPVRMPLPRPSQRHDSIYRVQGDLRSRYFR